MATLIYPDGRLETVAPANGKKFRLEEMQKIVGGYIELVPTLERKRMVVNEEGRLEKLPRNQTATVLMPRHYIIAGNFICGKALVLERGEG